MRRVRLALIVCAVFASILSASLAPSVATADRDALARELRNAWLPLESGMTVSRSEGTPISAKYEIDDGTFQLSVYTLRGDGFAEIIVDYSTGLIIRAETITDSGDLAAARDQRTVMAKAARTLEAATAAVVRAHPGYRAVSAMPDLRDGRPVVEVIMVNGTDWRTVFEALD